MKHILTILLLVGAMCVVGCGGPGEPTVGQPKEKGKTTLEADEAGTDEQTPTVNPIPESERTGG